MLTPVHHERERQLRVCLPRDANHVEDVSELELHSAKTIHSPYCRKRLGRPGHGPVTCNILESFIGQS